MIETREHWIAEISDAISAGMTLDGRGLRILDAAAHLLTMHTTAREQQSLVDLQRAAQKLVGIWEGDPRAPDVLHGVVMAWFAFEREWSADEGASS